MTVSVVLLQTLDQLRALQDQRPRTLDDAVVVGLAANLSLGQAVASAGALFRPYTDFVEATEFARVMQEARRTSDTWFGDESSLLLPPDLLESIRMEMLQSLSEIFLTQRVVSAVLDELTPAQVALAAGIDVKVAAVAAYEAEQRAIPILSLELAQPLETGIPLHTKLARFLRQEVRNACVLVMHRAAVLAHPKPTLLSFGSGVDSVNQRQLMPSIASAGVARPILVRSGGLDATMYNRAGQSKYPYLHFIPMNSMLRARKFVALGRRCWEAFQQREKSYQGQYGFLFANHRLRPFWERVFLHMLPHVIATQLDVRALLKRLRPGLVLTSNEVSFTVRALVLEAVRQGIPTLGLIHSGLNNMFYRDFRSDRMAVWGGVHVEDFVRVLGKDQSRLCPVGNPLYDTLAVEAAAQQAVPSGDGPRTPRVLVVTAIPQWTMFCLNLRQHLRSWQELERLPELGLQVTVKPHPRFDDYAFYDGLRYRVSDWREGAPGIAIARSTFLEDALPACDLVVVPGFSTTAAVEAMLFHKPVVYLMCGFEEPDFCTSIAPGCEVIRDVEQICPTILEILHSVERYGALVQKGQSYLDEFLGPRDRRATARLVRLIGQMMEPRV